MAELAISAAAELDFTNALCWYADRSVAIAERFDAEFGRSLSTIADVPDRYPKCDARHHFFLMRGFPYQIIYRHHQTNWVVVAVVHTSRAEQAWASR